jgi:hypothetical protein
VVCFCRLSTDSIGQTLQRLGDVQRPSQAAAPAAALPSAEATRVKSVAAWLGARLLPAAPWQPKPEWADLQPPAPQMPPAAMATISAIALLRTLAIAQLGADPLLPGAATALARVVTTLNARLPAISAQEAAAVSLPWERLAAISEASAQVELAASSGLFALPAARMQAYLAPGGRPMQEWDGLLDRITALLPLIAAATQLGPEMTEPGRLAEAMRQIKSVTTPKLADPALVARLTGLFDSLQRLRTTLGIEPTQVAYAEVAELVQAKAVLAAAMIPPGAQPPRVARNPTLLAPPAVVQAAMSPGIAELAALAWRVPPAESLPALAHVLPVAALVKALPAGASVQKQPCAQGCDSASLMRAAAA